MTASAGIAPNKFIAKICSDLNKPDGQYVVTPDAVDAFVDDLPLGKIPGVGKVTVKKLGDRGLHTCADIRNLGEQECIRQLGSLGVLLNKRARGIDDRPLTTEWVRKSLSVERTFPEDIPDVGKALATLESLFGELQRRLQPHSDRTIRNLQIKLKFADFSQTTMERAALALDRGLFNELLKLAWERGEGQGVRLIGLGVSFRDDDNLYQEQQLALF